MAARTVGPGTARARLVGEHGAGPGRADLVRLAAGARTTLQARSLEASVLAAGPRLSGRPGDCRLVHSPICRRAWLAADGAVDVAPIHFFDWHRRHTTDSQIIAQVTVSLAWPRADEKRGFPDRCRFYHRPLRHLPRARALGPVLHRLSPQLLSPAQDRHRHRRGLRGNRPDREADRPKRADTACHCADAVSHC